MEPYNLGHQLINRLDKFFTRDMLFASEETMLLSLAMQFVCPAAFFFCWCSQMNEAVLTGAEREIEQLYNGHSR